MTLLSVSVSVPPLLKMPPPDTPAVLPLTVLRRAFSPRHVELETAHREKRRFKTLPEPQPTSSKSVWCS
jgi:hypothetical protein